MNSFKIIGLITLFALAELSCTYKPTDEFFTDIEDQAPDPRIEIQLDPEQDTIFVDTITRIYFDISIYNKKLIVASFTLDTTIWSSDNKQGYFKVDPKAFNIGYDSLKIEIVTTSGTNSAADYFFLERLTHTEHRVINIIEP